VSVINATTEKVVASVTVGVGPTGATYDPASGAVFVDCVAHMGPGSLVAINDSTNSVAGRVVVGDVSFSVAYDPGAAEVFVPNQDSDYVTVITNGTGVAAFTVAPVFAVTFLESGVGTGLSWQVTLSSAQHGVSIELASPAVTSRLSRSAAGGSPISFRVSAGQFQYVATATGYGPMSGDLTVSGAPGARVTVSFAPVSTGPTTTSPPLTSTGVIAGIVLATIGAVGLGATAYRYRANRKERGQELVARLFDVESLPDVPPEGGSSPDASDPRNERGAP
jgi:hypothetical protein